MPSLYLNEYGATLGLVNDRLQVRRNGKLIQEIPALHLERVVLMVPANITQPAVRFLMERGIDIAYLSPNGTFYGRYSAGAGKSVETRLMQFQKFFDAAFRLGLAKTFIAGKISNMLALWRWLRCENCKELETLQKVARSLGNVSSLESLLGNEGAASAAHFQLFRKFLPREWSFPKRSPHPPPDPVNAMLSLGYTLLYSRMAGMLHMNGLDPYLGFFHESKHGHAALASDLIEEWRAPLVDALVLRFLNQRQVTLHDFEKAKGSVQMAKPALQKFLAAFEQRFQESKDWSALQDSGDPVSGMEGQVRQLVRVLLDKQKQYAPIRMPER